MGLEGFQNNFTEKHTAHYLSTNKRNGESRVGIGGRKTNKEKEIENQRSLSQLATLTSTELMYSGRKPGPYYIIGRER